MGIASSGSRKTIEIALRKLELFDFLKSSYVLRM